MIGKEIKDFDGAENAILKFCSENKNTIRIDKKVTVGTANKKASEAARITQLSDNEIYACR